MPTITVRKADLTTLIGRKLTNQDLDLVKGEIIEYDELQDQLKLELKDTNRPDLWCTEGIAREIGPQKEYAFTKLPAYSETFVDQSLEKIRPFIATFIARNISLDEALFLELLETQERLADLYGRKRDIIAIGLHNLEKITFPIYYKTAAPKEISFIPLGVEEQMTLDEILEKHPKGRTYGYTLRGQDRYPVLLDSKNMLLSFPPIINGRDTELKPGDKDLFVDITGKDLDSVILTANILATNFYDRGAHIEPLKVVYPYKTPYGNEVKTPFDIAKPIKIRLSEFEKLLGEPFDLKTIKEKLMEAGYRIDGDEAFPPLYRNDCMDSFDMIEDFAIRIGYHNFKPEPPQEYTIGGTTPIRSFADTIREILIGCGFEEIMSNVLTSRDELFSKTMLPNEDIIEVENVMSLSYSVLRHSIIPALLKVESSSSKARYPHKIFELGEVVIYDADENLGSKTLLKLAASISHAVANFSESHSYLDFLFQQLNLPYSFNPVNHSSFIDGRVGEILVNDKKLGIIGEIHPQVLENWGIKTPLSLFELNINALYEIQKTYAQFQ